MKELLLNKYGLNINIDKPKDIFKFNIDYNFYTLIKVKRPIEDIILISNQINDFYHQIVKTTSNKNFVSYNNENYILLKLNHSPNEEIILNDIVKNIIEPKIIDDLNRTNWSSLWERKNDYLEYQISELGVNHTNATKTFSYYLGISENACFYFNQINKSGKITFCQKRIFYPNLAVNYFNPLNLVIDYKVREYGEYIKSIFWKGDDALKILQTLCNLNILTFDEYNLLFARLLYPSFYFDDLQKSLEGESDDILTKYLDRAEEYKIFLRKCYFIILKKAKLLSIDWIIKER